MRCKIFQGSSFPTGIALIERNLLYLLANLAFYFSTGLLDHYIVAGGDKNIAWVAAPWLAQKRVAYWGDIDVEGLAIFSDVRARLAENRQTSVSALMMDKATLELHQSLMIGGSGATPKLPTHLTTEEAGLFCYLSARSQ